MRPRDTRLAVPVAPQQFESFDGWLNRLAAAHDATISQIFLHVGADPVLASYDLAAGVHTNGRYDHQATVELVNLLAVSVSLPLENLMACILPVNLKDLLPQGRRIYACPACWKNWYEANTPPYFARDWLLKICWSCLIHQVPLIDTAQHSLFSSYQIGRNLDRSIKHSQQIAETYCGRMPSRKFLEAAHNSVFNGETTDNNHRVRQYVDALRDNKFHLSSNRIALMASYANENAMSRRSRRAGPVPTIGSRFNRMFAGSRPKPPSPEMLEALTLGEMLECLFDVVRRPLGFQIERAQDVFGRLNRYNFRGRAGQVTNLGERLETAILRMQYINESAKVGPSRTDILIALGQSIACLEIIEIDEKSSDQTLLPTTTLRMMLASLHAESDLPAFNLGCTALVRALNARLVANTKFQNRRSIRSSAFFRDVPPADADTSFEAWASAHDPKSRYRRWRW